ncbi:MAG: type I-F CRISPR-associated protein Csy2 [Nanoarchaeota archaeon]|nr:type I-F CRISPR-associated protein Csy2 [Nanoarchaeota archaeon]
MNINENIQGILIFPHLKIDVANSLAGYLTYGFPALTSFFGLMGNLERKLQKKDIKIKFGGFGVICHSYDTAMEGNVFHLTSNPLNKDGSRPSIIYEGKINLEITLIFSIISDDDNILYVDVEDQKNIIKEIRYSFAKCSVAGGAIHYDSINPTFETIPEDYDERLIYFRKLRTKYRDGFTLVSRDNLLGDDATKITVETFLDRCTNKHRVKGSGWIVPIMVGYIGLTNQLDCSIVNGARRDYNIPCVPVEAVYSFGEWIHPSRLSDIQEMIWYRYTNINTGNYYCKNDYQYNF